MMIGGGEQGSQHVRTECADLTRYDRLDATPCGRHAKTSDAIEQADMNHFVCLHRLQAAMFMR